MSIDALSLSARHLGEVASSAVSVARATSRSDVSVTSFGLMNTALGAAVVPFVSRARSLTASLAEASSALAEGSRTLAEGWQIAEADSERAVTRLADALEADAP